LFRLFALTEGQLAAKMNFVHPRHDVVWLPDVRPTDPGRVGNALAKQQEQIKHHIQPFLLQT
jgi:hypothetical protein